MVSALDSGSIGPSFEPWLGMLTIFPIYSSTTSHHTRRINGPREFNAGRNNAMGQHPILDKVKILLVASNYIENGDDCWLMDHFTHIQTVALLSCFSYSINLSKTGPFNRGSKAQFQTILAFNLSVNQTKARVTSS